MEGLPAPSRAGGEIERDRERQREREGECQSVTSDQQTPLQEVPALHRLATEGGWGEGVGGMSFGMRV